GRAEIIVDAAKAEELWTPLAKAWFQGGPTDPELTLIKVSPEQAYYWDTKSNKMVSMMKILISTVTGNKNDDGVQGKLTV
ncbi:MAG TPA: pyridoxamine 5'-phosphate oxidase family protein, partial [Chitinophagales bacterium]|nr:pyridoxamine 5'-phosphate oxidase family protein [Chitinophagales bacterium]